MSKVFYSLMFIGGLLLYLAAYPHLKPGIEAFANGILAVMPQWEGTYWETIFSNAAMFFSFLVVLVLALWLIGKLRDKGEGQDGSEQ